MAKIKVGVFRGGPSSEYDISLRTGAEVLKALDGTRYEALDILVDKAGVWHLHGTPKEPHKICNLIDVAFNALHGEYGEDGKIQQIFERFGVPYTGSGIAASAASMHKRTMRDVLGQAGFLLPPGIAVMRDSNWADASAYAIRHLGFPLIIKPASRGSSIGVRTASNAYEALGAMAHAFKSDNEILIERRIPGREATGAVLERFRGIRHYAFPVIEIVPPAGRPFFDTACKYDGSAEEFCPGRFSDEIRDRIQRASMDAHTALGCRHYSRSDFIVTPKNEVYILELNTLPGLTDQSLFPKAAASIGLEFPQFVHHVLSLALHR
ncbi:MAG: D-alanine--D-alanine ligase [Candidatus Niyogibacteria bacterium]|nr:D-alanine--D-alanine ligase [Candidatus Niyogibacteria bacterium]